MTGVLATPIKTLFCPSDTASGTPIRSDRTNLEGQPIAVTNYKGVSGQNWQWGEARWNNVLGANGSKDGLGNGDGLFYRLDSNKKIRLADIIDGTSNTFMIGEDIPERSAWCCWAYANDAVGTCAIYPNSKNPNNGLPYSSSVNNSTVSFTDWTNTYSFRSRHVGGLQFAYADGSVHALRSGSTYLYAVPPDDGSSVGNWWDSQSPAWWVLQRLAGKADGEPADDSLDW